MPGAVCCIEPPYTNTTNTNTFQIVMYFDGRIEINYLAVAVTDGLSGLVKPAAEASPKISAA